MKITSLHIYVDVVLKKKTINVDILDIRIYSTLDFMAQNYYRDSGTKKYIKLDFFIDVIFRYGGINHIHISAENSLELVKHTDSEAVAGGLNKNMK